tara:strand:+ start:560 stop:1741 length:1182 start_codon:yes stop_codon:yes gene_type:complete
MYSNFNFEVEINRGDAKLGKILTPHGEIKTPAFIFCATHGCIKGLTAEQIKECDTQIILANTYHLEVFPGAEHVKRLGGLQKMTGFNGPMLTDSGGYQVFAMGHGSVSKEIKGNKTHRFKPTLLGISEDGATFISYKTKQKISITPEKSIQIQNKLGADIILVFDECTPYNVSKEYTKKSMERSHRWSLRCIEEFKKLDDKNQSLYGIVQGGIYDDLRKESAEFNNIQPFFGIAVGGCLGDTREIMHSTVKKTMNYLRKDRPIHLLGIGGIYDIFNGVRCGIDTFDCVHPTRIARHGCALVKPKDYNKKENIDLSKGKYRDDLNVIDFECSCSTCKNGKGYSRAYLHYLIKTKETTYGSLIMIHNVKFMNQLMEDIRYGLEFDILDEIELEYI